MPDEHGRGSGKIVHCPREDSNLRREFWETSALEIAGRFLGHDRRTILVGKPWAREFRAFASQE